MGESKEKGHHLPTAFLKRKKSSNSVTGNLYDFQHSVNGSNNQSQYWLGSHGLLLLGGTQFAPESKWQKRLKTKVHRWQNLDVTHGRKF